MSRTGGVNVMLVVSFHFTWLNSLKFIQKKLQTYNNELLMELSTQRIALSVDKEMSEMDLLESGVE